MKHILLAACAVAILSGCGSQGKQAAPTGNPFLSEYTTPFQVPPFDQIKMEHYKPAFLQGMEEQQKEIDAIVNNPEPATFQNTIAALDQSGALLRKVSTVFYGLKSANTNDEMDALSRELSPLQSKHSDDIALNEKLFARIKAVYENPGNLDKEQKKLLEETYKDFVRGGANLDAESQKKLRELNSEISMLQLTFGQNMQKETNAFQLIVDKEEDLAGLPQNLIASAAETAKEAGMEGKWIFTLHNPSVMPFLQYADNRDLREKIFKGYINRGNNGNEYDNKEVVRKLLKARLEKAKMMGYENYASFALEERMAKTPDAVYKLLDQIWTPTLSKAKEELADINAEIKKDGKTFTAEGWDWRYYADRAKKAKFDLDENQVRPYLKLENVRDGVFYVANKLYGITFTQLDNLPLPHPDAQAFECKDKDGSHLGVLYMDFFPRASKKGGAWCGSYRSQTYKDGKKVAPVVTVVCNFTKPAARQPALLSADEANTLFHEFGHALHNLFKDVHYYGEYLAASLLDMDYHVLKEIPDDMDVMQFEAETLGKRGLLKQIPSRYRTTYFNHTMGGGYTAGYYSYIWAEVLDCDAYEAYKETGDIFNQEVAGKFRKYILTPGCIDDAMDMYVNFRGKEPGIDPLLKNRGLK